MPTDHRTTFVHTLATLHARLKPLLSAAAESPSSPAGLTAAQPRIAADLKSLPGVLDDLRVTLGRSTDAAMRNALESLVGPCLQQLASAARRIARAVAGYSKASSSEVSGGDASAPGLPPCHDLRGRAWVLLGLLRWVLLLPKHPVDPAIKHAVKREDLRAKLQMWGVHFRATELSQATWNGAVSSGDLQERAGSIATASSDMHRISTRACVRPPAPAAQFVQLHREAMQWHRSLGAPAAVLQLSSDLHRGGVGGALIREVGWQQSSARFAERLASCFGGHEDVEGPLRLAVYEVKHGLRIQAAACTRTALSASEGSAAGSDGDAAQSLMRAVVAYPQQLSLSSMNAVSSDGVLPKGMVPLLQPLPAAIPSCIAVGHNETRSCKLQAQHWRVSQQSSLLVLAVRRLYVVVLLGGQARRLHLDALNRIMSVFAQTQVEVEAAEARRQAEAAQLFKHKVSAFGSTIDESAQEVRTLVPPADNHRLEMTNACPVSPNGQCLSCLPTGPPLLTWSQYDALRSLFPDYTDEFADLEDKLKVAGMHNPLDADAADAADVADVADADMAKDGEQSGATESNERGPAVASSSPIQVDPGLILQLASYHLSIFGSTKGAQFVALNKPGGTEDSKGVAKRALRGTGKSRAQTSNAASLVTSAGHAHAQRDAWRLSEAQREVRAALCHAHDLASDLMPTVAPLLPASLDVDARGAQLALTCLTWQRLQGRTDQDGSTSRTPQDILSEGNSEEVGRFAPLVESIGAHAKRLLLQFPGHASLQVLLDVCDRIGGFRIGSPLMKFVTAAELLLKQCWAWEQVASRATSMQECIEQLTQLVLRWRKMELHAWPRLLECTAVQVHERALCQVWVRLFRVLHSSAATSSEHDAMPVASVSATSDPADEITSTEADVAGHLQDFFGIVEQMMLSSTVGAYEAHLRLLVTFETQLRVEENLDDLGSFSRDAPGDERQRRRSGYASILHNVAGYYHQFMEALRQATALQMVPIEAKIAEFTKLGQWNDRNHAALKQSIERSHEQLKRSITQYKGLLEQPAAILLASRSQDDETEDGQPETVATPPRSMQAKLPSPAAISSDAQVTSLLMQPSSTQKDALPGTGGIEGIEGSCPSPFVALVQFAKPVGAAASPEGSDGAEGACGNVEGGVLKCTRLPFFCQRMQSFCARVIMSASSAARSELRRGHLVELRETIVARYGCRGRTRSFPCSFDVRALHGRLTTPCSPFA